MNKILWGFIRNPQLLLILSFIILILVGASLLNFSLLSDGSRIFSFMDTLATATSAVTVTGLWFYPQLTLSEFSLFGQIVILILIQLGGLGAMTAGAFLLIFLKGKLTLTEQEAMRGLLGRKFLSEVAPLVRVIIIYTFFIELAGFALFLSQWISVYPLEKAIFYSLFHSVSAFCNAGFTLFNDSFVQYQNDVIINSITMILIVLGGLGFVVLVTLKTRISSLILREKPRRVDLHSKIVLSSTLAFILLGFLVFFSFEAVHLNLSWENRILTSLFQSVTARTAGFNTVDVSGFSTFSLFFFTILMYIGAGPFSTSGGIKITTFILAILLILNILKRKTKIEIWRYRIPDEVLWRGMCLIVTSLLTVAFFLGILLYTESFAFEKILFELTSAFGTVGLSTGITYQLSIYGKITLSIVMLIGRLGPLTLIYLMARKRERPEIQLVEDGSVIVG